VKRIAGRFRYEQTEPHIVKAELRTNLGNGNKIFICSGCDLFAPNIPDEYIFSVVAYTCRFPNNEYLFQTKNPKRTISASYGLSTSLHKICTTIETNRWVPEVMRNSPPATLRALALAMLADRGFRTMVTVEPIIDFDLDKMLWLLRMTKAGQVNIGADSGNNGLPEPPAEKIRELITELKTFTRVVEKRNLRRLFK
jgi:DNA repair photolyase